MAKETVPESLESLFTQADDILTDFVARDSTDTFNEIKAIMDGTRKCNRDHKRVLCNDINRWIDFLALDDSRHVQKFRVTREGNIEMYDPDIEPELYLEGGQMGKYGNLG